MTYAAGAGENADQALSRPCGSSKGCLQRCGQVRQQFRQAVPKGLGDQQRRPYHRDIEEQRKYQIRCLGCLFQPHHLLHKKYQAGRVECSAGLADETAFLLCSVRSCFLMDLFSGRGRLLPGIQLRLIVFQPFQNRRPLTRHRPGSRFPAAG